MNSDKAKEITDALEFVRLVDELRAGTACSLEILCDNSAMRGHANSAVICSGSWTFFARVRFEADSVLACLRLAGEQRRKAGAAVVRRMPR